MECLVGVKVKTKRAENSFFEINYYRKTVKVATFSMLIVTLLLIILFAHLISSLFVVLEHVFQLLKRIKLIETEEKKTSPRPGTVGYQRRKHTRFNIDLPVHYNEIDSSIAHYGRALNLSEGGMLIHSAEQMEIGRHLKSKLSFISGSEMNTIEMQAEVVWTDIYLNEAWGDYRSGVKFLNTLAKDKTTLTNFLKSLSQ